MFLSYGAFVHFYFSLSENVIAWRECWLSTPYHVIMESYTLIVGVLKYVLFLGVLSALSFILSCFCPVAFLSNFCFFLSAHVIAWWECWLSTTVSCDHRIVHLDCWSIKIFSLFGGFACFEFYPLGFCPMPFLYILLFSVHPRDRMTRMLIIHPWRECWLSLSFMLCCFVLWRFCPFLLFSVHPRDRMTRTLIVDPCIIWSWDRTAWLLEY